MNDLKVAVLTSQVDAINQSIKELKRDVQAFKIDRQRFVQVKEGMKPGTATKVAYNRAGVITGTMSLDVGDIPILPTTKIGGLHEELSKIVNRDEIKRMISEEVSKATSNIRSYHSKDTLQKPAVSNSEDTINELKKEVAEVGKEFNAFKSDYLSNNVAYNHTGTIGVNNMGRVVQLKPLTMNDLPIELFERLNNIEMQVASSAPNSRFDDLVKLLNVKINRNFNNVEGNYYKVSVNSDGLVTAGTEKLTKKDLPTLQMADIEGLVSYMSKKANNDDITTLNNQVAQLTNSFSALGNIQLMKQKLDSKASNEDVLKLTRLLEDQSAIINKCIEALDTIEILSKAIDKINRTLATLEVSNT